jgi:hypothetical protein
LTASEPCAETPPAIRIEPTKPSITTRRIFARIARIAPPFRK